MSDDSDDDTAQHEASELRALWSALPAPRAGVDTDGLPSEDVAASDDLTRAAVERLRAAWAAHSVHVPELPFALRRAHARRATRTAPTFRHERTRPGLRLLALAAAAAAVVSLFVSRHERTSRHVELTGEGRVIADSGDTQVDPGTGAPRELEPSPLPTALVATHVDIPREDFALRADGFEFETQGVRFVLIETTGDADSSAPEKKE